MGYSTDGPSYADSNVGQRHLPSCGERIEDRAFRHVFARALRYEPGQEPLDAPEVGDLGPDFRQMRFCPFLDLGAGLALTIDEVQQEDHDLEEELRYVDQLLRVDPDGTRFIDYLGASESEFDDPADFFLFLESHAELVRRKLAATTGRVREKFEWLAAYHNSVVKDVVTQFADGRRSAGEFIAEYDLDPEPFLSTMIINPAP